jgi:ubiquitin carboxyl-terminal hydrolase 14
LDGTPGSLNALYTSMSRTTEAYVPAQFLNVMRQSFPQFAERSRASGNKLLQGFAQQGNKSVIASQLSSSDRIYQMPKSVIPRSLAH